MKRRGVVLVPLLIMIGAVVAFGAMAYVVWHMNASNDTDNTNQVACTLEAKLCPDGTSVGRVPPSCEFAACPEPVTCGTIAGLPCPAGYTCQLENTNATDAAGTCFLSSGANTNTAANTNATNTNASANTNTAATIPSGWQIYNNSSEEYTIYHPLDWGVLMPDSSLVLLAPSGSTGTDASSPGVFVKLETSVRNDDTVSERTTVTVGGVSVTKQKESGLPQIWAYYFPRSSGGYIKVSWTAASEGSYPQYTDIVATFRFFTPTRAETN